MLLRLPLLEGLGDTPVGANGYLGGILPNVLCNTGWSTDLPSQCSVPTVKAGQTKGPDTSNLCRIYLELIPVDQSHERIFIASHWEATLFEAIMDGR